MGCHARRDEPQCDGEQAEGQPHPKVQLLAAGTVAPIEGDGAHDGKQEGGRTLGVEAQGDAGVKEDQPSCVTGFVPAPEGIERECHTACEEHVDLAGVRLEPEAETGH